MKLSKRIATTVIALPLLMGSMSAMAFGGKHQGGESMMGGKHLLRGIELTATQKDELNELREEHHNTMRTNRGEHKRTMMTDRKEMQSLILADNFDESAIRVLAEKMSDQQVERRITMMRKKHEMLSILTPEQKAQIVENMAQTSERHQNRMKHHG